MALSYEVEKDNCIISSNIKKIIVIYELNSYYLPGLFCYFIAVSAD